MVLRENAVLLVKLYDPGRYDFPRWEEYRMNKGRNLEAVHRWLLSLDSFRYASIFAYDKKRGGKGQQIGFITRAGVQY